MILSVRLRRPNSSKQVAFGLFLRPAILKADVGRNCRRHQARKNHDDEDDREDAPNLVCRQTSHPCVPSAALATALNPPVRPTLTDKCKTLDSRPSSLSQ